MLDTLQSVSPNVYNKLFTKILDSSIWLESTPTRIVWLTMIAVMDQDGFAQFAASKNVAHRARVTNEEAEEALKILEGPDPDSSNPDNDGRRLERVPGGWIVLNAEKHREIVTGIVQREQNRIRVQRFRDKQRNGDAVTESLPAITCNTSETETEADTEEEAAKSRSNNKPDRKGASAFKATNGARTPYGGPIIGRNPHLDHAACDDAFSYCVPSAVHRKLADLLAPKHGGDREAAKIELQAWYPTIWRTIPADKVIGDAFRFWQACFDETFANAKPAKKRQQTTQELTDAVRAQMIAAGEM